MMIIPPFLGEAYVRFACLLQVPRQKSAQGMGAALYQEACSNWLL